MSFEEVKKMFSTTSTTSTTSMKVYDEDGNLNPQFATLAFCQMKRESLLELPSGVLADVILDSREVFNKASEIEYVAVNLLAACLTALTLNEPNLTRMFKKLTHEGTRNITPDELSELLHGFVFSKSSELHELLALDKMMQ
jgi:hypothetical protein